MGRTDQLRAAADGLIASFGQSYYTASIPATDAAIQGDLEAKMQTAKVIDNALVKLPSVVFLPWANLTSPGKWEYHPGYHPPNPNLSKDFNFLKTKASPAKYVEETGNLEGLLYFFNACAGIPLYSSIKALQATQAFAQGVDLDAMGVIIREAKFTLHPAGTLAFKVHKGSEMLLPLRAHNLENGEPDDISRSSWA